MISRPILALSGALMATQIVVAQGAVPAPVRVPAPIAAKNPAPSVSYRQDVLPIFRTTCVMCHQDLGAMGGLSLTSPSPAAQLVNVPSSESPLLRIAPGKPELSYLVRKVEATHVAAPGAGLAMPIGQAPLTKTELGTLRRWISQGAPDN